MLCIVLYHSGIYYKDTFYGWLDPFHKYGGIFGNLFFFWLSGFLLAFGNKKKIQLQELTFLPYLKRRMEKIYPLYFLVNIVCVVWLGLIIRHQMADLKQLLYNVLLINWGWVENISPLNGPAWFLSTLLLCYIIFYFLCWISRSNENMFMYLSLIMAFWGYIILQQGINLPFNYTDNGQAYLSFFLGCFWSEIYVRMSDDGKKSLAVFFAAVLLVLGVLSQVYGFGRVINDIRMIPAILLIPAVIWVSIEIGWIRKILEIKVLVFLGKISMSVMLWHRLLLDLTYVYFRRTVIHSFSEEAKMVIYLLIVLVVGILSYYLFEKQNIFNKLWTVLRKKIEKKTDIYQSR